jgi:glycosyltransferase involved in cell wall biosynthesis
MACGTPVIVARTSSIPEVVGQAGLYFAPDNGEEMAAKMLFLAGNRRRRDDLRQRGLERVGHFTWRRTAEMTLEVYRSVAL